MRDVDRCEPEFVVQPADLLRHFLAQVGVEVGQGLVEQQHFGSHDHRAGQRHALLLPARQLGRVALRQRCQVHQLQHLVHALLGLLGRRSAHVQAEAHVLGHRHVRPDRVALENHGHAPVLGRDRALRGRDRPAVDLDRPGCQLDEAGDHPQSGRLAATRGAEQGDELALVQVQAQVVDHRDRAVVLADALECQFGHRVSFVRAGAA